jgi:hypothetical protein
MADPPTQKLISRPSLVHLAPRAPLVRAGATTQIPIASPVLRAGVYGYEVQFALTAIAASEMLGVETRPVRVEHDDTQ